MTWDPLMRRAVQLLASGHNLYGLAEHSVAGPEQPPAELEDRAEALRQGAASDGIGSSVKPHIVRLTRALRSTADTNSELDAVLSEAGSGHRLGRRVTGMVLDEAYDDSAPAADTPLGRREALRRMATRLRTQHHHVNRSHRLSHGLAQRTRQLNYPDRRRTPRSGHASGSRPLPLRAVRYEKSHRRGHVRYRIAEALDHLGITDPAARHNWIRGYETLIARESGGRASAVASEPAIAPGTAQPDGHGLGYARGLTQTIPATFARFHQPGTSTDIYDPVANICASMNYVRHRYGVSLDGANLIALVQQADARRPPKGY
ncbi:MAG: transglycosylase SLT domain-containing protein [Mycobacterium sp.]|uniref:transglycosylase SLT domain-containing protein n=1 Tax=Mycobacterium sp. TaxID=1785 RepID=UPI003CC67DB4